MGCGCGGNKNPAPVTEDTPNPNLAETDAENEAWWQANPKLPTTAAVPMPL